MVEESGGKWGIEHFLWRDRNTKPNILKPQTKYPKPYIHDMGHMIYQI